MLHRPPRIAAAALASSVLALALAAQSPGGLACIDASESGEALRFRLPSGDEPIAVTLLDAARWDELRFEVHGAVVGARLDFRVIDAPLDVLPEVHDGAFTWRRPAVVLRNGTELWFSVVPAATRLLIRLAPPAGPPDAAYYAYTRFTQYMAALQSSPLAQITQVGTSVQGRPLYRIVIDRPSSQAKKAVLMTVRQHGNEYGSSYLLEGALDLLLARDGQVPEPELLDRVRWIVYPLVNPDGAVANARENAHGVDLNRDWRRTGCSPIQEPETFALQCDIESFQALYGFAIGGDHHGWGQATHGGYRYALGQSVSLITVPPYQEAKKDTTVITRHDPTQIGWEENGGTAGMIRAELFLRFGFLLHTPEYNSSLSSEAQFREKGRAWVRAMLDTLHAPRFTDASGAPKRLAVPPDRVWITVDDDDENLLPGSAESVLVTALAPATGDTETVLLTETGTNTGVFRSTALPVELGAAAAGNGTLETQVGSSLVAVYADDDYPRDTSEVVLPVVDALPVGEARARAVPR
jgi:hypothetical protein